MMKININKFLYQESLNKQRKLFKECFPETINSSLVKESHYFWKFHSFPSYIHSYEFEAFAQNDLIGYYAALPYQYVINSSIVNVGMVCDVMTGVKARGKGVFTKIGKYSTDEMQKKGVDFTTGFPIRKEVIPGHLKVGWEIMHQLPLFVKFLSFKSLLKSKKVIFLSYPIDILLNVFNFILSILIAKKESKIELYSSNNIEDIKGIDSFLKEWVNQQPIALNKSVEFLKWRLGAPNKTYKILIIRKNERVVGYSVFSEVVKENIPSIAILDTSFLKEYSNISGVIYKAVSKFAKERKIEAIIVMASNTTFKKHKMRKIGFVKAPFKFSFILKNLSKQYGDEILKDENNWHLMWIDSDNM